MTLCFQAVMSAGCWMSTVRSAADTSHCTVTDPESKALQYRWQRS
jgi:hypothetical protein